MIRKDVLKEIIRDFHMRELPEVIERDVKKSYKRFHQIPKILTQKLNPKPRTLNLEHRTLNIEP